MGWVGRWWRADRLQLLDPKDFDAVGPLEGGVCQSPGGTIRYRPRKLERPKSRPQGSGSQGPQARNLRLGFPC
jgi:hypothetical protein